MSTVAPYQTQSNSSFDTVVAPFLQDEGLPFAEVLTAQDIQQAFAQENALFAQEDIFSTPIVLWAFLAQSLCDGKESACKQAITDIRAYLLQRGLPIPSPNTGDYCRARVKLSPLALRRLARQVAKELQRRADPSWLWHGMDPKLVDGFTFTMMDTPDNQRRFPQLTSQAPGVGFPIARACVILSLATAAAPRDDTRVPSGDGAPRPKRRKIVAKAQGRQPRELSFTGACQSVLSSWMLLSTGAYRDPRRRWECVMEEIVANVVANRPGRVEPRACLPAGRS